MRPLVFVLSLAVLAVVSCGKDRNPIVPKRPVVGNEIIFTSNRDADELPDLYASNADGTGFHRLTSDTAYDSQARWSPDGTRIVFLHGYDISESLTVMDVDGATRAMLVSGYSVRGPCWSPDGAQIAYQRGYSYGQANPNQLWVMNADGTSPHVVIDYDSLNGVDQISWTHRNTFLGTDGFGLVEFDANGKNRRRILSKIGVGNYPRVSPDGSKIAFAWTGGVGYTPNIYVVNADGTGLKQLTDNVNESGNPVWSPDGSKIAFTGPSATLWTMNVDGSNQKQIQLPSDATQPYDYIGDWK